MTLYLRFVNTSCINISIASHFLLEVLLWILCELPSRIDWREYQSSSQNFEVFTSLQLLCNLCYHYEEKLVKSFDDTFMFSSIESIYEIPETCNVFQRLCMVAYSCGTSCTNHHQFQSMLVSSFRFTLHILFFTPSTLEPLGSPSGIMG